MVVGYVLRRYRSPEGRRNDADLIGWQCFENDKGRPESYIIDMVLLIEQIFNRTAKGAGHMNGR